MDEPWVVASLAVSVVAVVIAGIAARAAIASARAGRDSADEARRARAVAETADHRQRTPSLRVEREGRVYEHGGLELRMRSQDSDLASVVVRVVDDASPPQGNRISLGLTPGPAPPPVGTPRHALDLGPIPLGESRSFWVWSSALVDVDEAVIRFRCECTIGAESWTVPLETTYPLAPPNVY